MTTRQSLSGHLDAEGSLLLKLDVSKFVLVLVFWILVRRWHRSELLQ